ncbi:hypothetical protein ACFLVP_01245 [Chloroflexota bacterium]
MECEWCERTFQKLPYKRVIRGKRYIFCGEGCFNLWLYKQPKFDIDETLRRYLSPVPYEIFDEAMKEDVE